jgi:dephospho-CoA kinase
MKLSDLCPKKSVIGLTGGIASGKSTVGRWCSEQGFEVIDADQLARELREPGGAASTEIFERFKTLDRTQLRALIFSDPESRRDLEKILHPWIQKISKERMIAAQSDLVVYEASLLFETGRETDFDGVVLVTSDVNQRVRRAAERDGVDPKQIEGVIGAQMSDDLKKTKANWIIENNSDLPALFGECARVFSQIRADLSKRP